MPRYQRVVMKSSVEATGELAAPVRNEPTDGFGVAIHGSSAHWGARGYAERPEFFAVLGARVPNPVPKDFGI